MIQFLLNDSRDDKRYETSQEMRLFVLFFSNIRRSLMISLPKTLTAETGMDALTHAIESYISKMGNTLTKELALTAIRLVFTHLPAAVEEPENIAARDGMAYAAYMAGMSFGNAGTGLVHAMGHQLGGLYDLGHGLGNAILLPYVLEYNRCVASEGLAEITQSMWPEASRALTMDEKVDVLINKIRELSRSVGTMVPLSDLGIREEDFERMALGCFSDGTMLTNPSAPTKEDIMEIYRKSSIPML